MSDSAGPKDRSPNEQKKYRASLHNHTNSDPNDPIRYSNEDLIDHAAAQGFKILAITCHNKLVFSKKLKKYAKDKGILLIPGTEQSIRNRHFLILGANKEAEKVRSWEALRKYREENPKAFIMANHPYFPGLNMLCDQVKKHKNLLDAVELSWWYSPLLNFNKKAHKLGLPMIGTSDTHFIKYHGITHCEIEVDELTQEKVFASLREGKFKNVTTPISIWQMMLMPFIALRDKTWMTIQRLKNMV